MEKINISTNSFEDTMKLGIDFSKNIKPGDIVGLIGDLAAGKTTFVKGVLEGLGYNYTVSSPTFTLINNYEASLDVPHLCRRAHMAFARPIKTITKQWDSIMDDWEVLDIEETADIYRLKFSLTEDDREKIFLIYSDLF